MSLARALLLTLCLAACSPSKTSAPPPTVPAAAQAPDTTSTPASDVLAAPPDGGEPVLVDVAAPAPADVAPAMADGAAAPADGAAAQADAASAEDTPRLEETGASSDTTGTPAGGEDELAALVAEMTRAPTEELAERLTALGHIGFFTEPDGGIVPTGFPAINADATLIAVAGPPVRKFGASAGWYPVALTFVRLDGTHSAELMLTDPNETFDAAVQASRLKAAREALGSQTWRTMKALTPIEWFDGEHHSTPAFVADDGTALLEFSQWSVTADLNHGPWRATLPEAARVEPGGPFRDEEGARCEMGRYVSAASVDPEVRVVLLSVVFFPKNDLCRARITSYVPMRLPGPSGGEGWTQAKRGAAPPWFAGIAELVPDPSPDDGELLDEVRLGLELFIARWGARFPTHRAVRNAKRVLEADRKARAQP